MAGHGNLRPDWLCPLQKFDQLDQILPCGIFASGVAQIIGGVIAGYQRNPSPLKRLSACLTDRVRIACQTEKREFSQAKDDFWANEFQLVKEICLA